MGRRQATQTLQAAAVAGALSGVPSTLHALLTGRSPLAAARAAGNLLLPSASPPAHLLAAGAVAHAAVSLFWAAILVPALPRHRPVVWGAAAGIGIAAVDLGLVARRFPLIRALPPGPQWADHIAFGALVGTVVGAQNR